MELAELNQTVLYLRKSRADPLSVEETLVRHKEQLIEFASKNGLTITHIYEEIVSGDSLYARPEMLKLLQDAENKGFDSVMCMDFDRLGRSSMSEQGIILETLKNSNIVIITPRKIYDLNNEMDEEYSEFESFFARRELKTIKRRLQNGIKKTLHDGGYIANAPYGYTKTKVGKKPTLEINEEEAQFVRIMFDEYVNQGHGCQIIADKINSMGAKPHRSEKFGRTSVMKILRNNVYIGKIVWNQKTQIRKNTKNNQKQIIIYNPRDQWLVTDGIHPPIIDEETFYKAQEIFKGRYHPPSFNGTIQNPLAGLVFCSQCGSLMQRQLMKGSPDGYLLCNNKECSTVSSRLPFVEKALLNALRDKISYLYSLDEKQKAKSDIDYETIISDIERKKATAQAQLQKLHDFLEQGIYDIDTFLARQVILKNTINELEKSEEEVVKKQKENRNLNIIAMCQKINDVFTLYESSDNQHKNQLLKSIISRVEYKKEKGAKPSEFTLVVSLRLIYY